MIILPNMGLFKWDSINDFFSHEQLAANFQALDEHSHIAGKGVPIPYGGLAEQSVGKENLREGAFDASMIANKSVTDAKLAKPIIAGIIGSAGEIKAGTGFTVEKGTTGKYTIVLTTELGTEGVLIAIPVAFTVCPTVTLNGKKSLRVAFAEPSPFTLKDTEFHFIIKAT